MKNVEEKIKIITHGGKLIKSLDFALYQLNEALEILSLGTLCETESEDVANNVDEAIGDIRDVIAMIKQQI